ncbi:hypothetical protein [Desulfovibrio cuneatus]|uniref:hypothetical protein n=1 Tax=Desulfovibrio cuneatus TaxID=159728 RepID=UPI00042A2BFC|nr:hypothetical protein [Desulfovibrio cuneatus]
MESYQTICSQCGLEFAPTNGTSASTCLDCASKTEQNHTTNRASVPAAKVRSVLHFFGNGLCFFLLYMLFLLPTYMLPYLGSTSSLSILSAAASGNMNPILALHFTCMVGLVVTTGLRGYAIKHLWLLIFPLLAMAFEFIPLINWIPLVPTVLHAITLFLGFTLGIVKAVTK